MKNALIVILSVALCAAAFLTRPTEDEFKAFVRDHAERQKYRLPRSPGRRGVVEPPMARAEFKDCILWVELRVEGRLVYAGAFNHWWDRTGCMEHV